MSVKSLTNTTKTNKKSDQPLASRFGVAILYCIWVIAGFGLAQGILYVLLQFLQWVGVPFDTLNVTVLTTTVYSCVYALTLLIVVGAPWLIRKIRTTKEELGFSRLPSWTDIALAPAGFVIYLPVALVLTFVAQLIIPGFQVDQVQQVGFDGISYHYEYILAFITLIVIAPFAEEIVFRGYLQGKLRKYLPFWLVAILTSALFGLAHGQWNVAVDVFALGLVLSVLREMTGSIWAGILLHMAKNAIAFYFIFVSPLYL